jgi:hypothetical protein
VLWFLNRSRLLEEGKLKRARFDIFVNSEGGLISGDLTSGGFCPNLIKKYIYKKSKCNIFKSQGDLSIFYPFCLICIDRLLTFCECQVSSYQIMEL